MFNLWVTLMFFLCLLLWQMKWRQFQWRRENLSVYSLVLLTYWDMIWYCGSLNIILLLKSIKGPIGFYYMISVMRYSKADCSCIRLALSPSVTLKPQTLEFIIWPWATAHTPYRGWSVFLSVVSRSNISELGCNGRLHIFRSFGSVHMLVLSKI